MRMEINILSANELWSEFQKLVKNLSHIPTYFRHAFKHLRPKHEEVISATEISPAGVFTAPIRGTQQALFRYKNEEYGLKLVVSRQLPSRWLRVYFKDQNQEEEWFFHESNITGVTKKLKGCIEKIEAVVPICLDALEESYTTQANK